jgi:hypothetical protein
MQTKYLNFSQPMDSKCTALINQVGDWWVGWIEGIPGVNCQETSQDELIESLKVTLQEAIAFNREESAMHKNL